MITCRPLHWFHFLLAMLVVKASRKCNLTKVKRLDM